MNLSQRQNIINSIDSLKSLNLEEIFAAKFGEETNPENVSAGDFSVLEAFTLTRRVLIQLEERINDSQSWPFMPAVHNFNNDFGSCDLRNNLQTLLTYINRSDFTNIPSVLNPLIYYQIANNFWEKSLDFEQKKKLAAINDIETKLNFLLTHLDERKSLLVALMTETNELKQQLTSFIEEKNNEFETLDERLKNSEETMQIISDKKDDIARTVSESESLKEDCDNIKREITSMNDEFKEIQSEIDSYFGKFKEDSQKELSDSNTKLNQINEDHRYVDNVKEEVRKMMSYISDGTLSHSFNNRKKEILKNTTIWLWVSVVSAILMGAWIFIVFTCLKASTGNIAIDMLINAVKTTPLIALFWFSLKQYSKERNLLEEYAFREAIAVTLTAYAEQINQTTTNNQNKIDMIRGTVDRLYTKPQISNEGIGLFSFKSKDLVDLLKEVKEIVSEIKSSK